MTPARVARSVNLTPARLLGGLLLGGALALTAAQAVQAADAPATHTPARANCAPGSDPIDCPWHEGRHAGKHHGKHHGHGMHGEMHTGLPFAGPGFERLLDDIKATDAQRKQIGEIMNKARTDLRALHEQAQPKRQGIMTLWTAPKLDAADAEKQRQHMLAHHDQVSRRMVQAQLDVGRVLTPEQRAQAAAALQKRQDNKQAREDARQERLHNHMLRRTAPAASAPASAASPAAPSR